MQDANKERWQELCELAAKEHNSEKLAALIHEINRLLGEKLDRANAERDKTHAPRAANR